MSKRDVELIIRARNEASAAVDSVSKAMSELTERQEVLGRSAQKTDGLLGALADELDKLKTVAASVTSLNRLRDSVDQSGEAFRRQADELARAKQQYDELARDQAAATRAAKQQEAAVESGAQALAAQRREVEELRKIKNAAAVEATRDANAVLRAEKTLAAAREKYAKGPTEKRESRIVDAALELQRRRKAAEQSALAEQQLTREYATQTAALAANRAAQQAATDTLGRMAGAQNTLASKLTATGAAIATNTARLNQAEQEYASLAQVVDRAEREFAQFAAAQGVQGQAAQRAAVQIAVLKARMQELQAAQRAARPNRSPIEADEVREAVIAFREAVTVIDRASNASTRSSVSLRQLGQAVDTVARSGKELRSLDSALSKQEQAVESARAEWASAQAEVKRLAGAMKASAAPSDQLAAAFGRALGQARAAKTAFLEQRAGADQMAAGFRNAGVGYGDLASSATRLTSMLATSNSALAQGRSLLLSFAGGANSAAGGGRRLASTMAGVGAAGGTAARGIKSMLAELMNLNSETRTSLSLGQRLRGQVLGLAASSGGVFAVQSALAGVVQASMDMEAVQSRFSVAFQGDQAKVAQSMQFSRDTADELGLSLRTVALQYSRVASASLGTALEGEKTQRLFYNMAEAARVLRLSDEELAGSMKAVTDILSKGTIMAEELKGQLGDRFPGAVGIMATALGVGTAELMKMMEAGELTSDKLAKFGEEISRRVGPAKAEAIRSTAAEFQRLNNAILDIQLTVANSGFLSELTDGTEELASALKDPAVQAGFSRLGEALGNLINAMAALLPYTEEVITLLKALALVMAVKVGGGLLGDLLKGLQGLRKAYGWAKDGVNDIGKAAKNAGGGVRGLRVALGGLAVATAGYTAVAYALWEIGSRVWDWYEAEQKLERQREKIERQRLDSYEKLRLAQEELTKATEQSGAGLLKARDNFELTGDTVQAMARDTVRGLQAGAAAQDDFIRSSEQLMRMSVAELAAYRKVVEARKEVVQSLLDTELVNPVGEQNLERISRLRQELRRLDEAAAGAANWHQARTQAIASTAASAQDLALALAEATAEADTLRNRMQATAQHNFDNTIVSLERVRDARIAALTLSGADESQILTATNQFEQQRLQLVRQYSQRQYDIIRQDEERRKQLLDMQKLDAGKRAEELLKIEQGAAQARVQVAQREVQEVASAREAALGRYMAALQRVADLDRRIADIRLNGEFQVADIRRSAMTDYEAYISRRNELVKLNGRIQDEVAKGNLEVAEALAQRQLSLAQSLNQEVKDGETVLVSKELAAANAVKGTQKANENLIAVLQKRQEIARKEADEQKKLYENLTATLEKLNTTLARMSGATTIDIPLTVDQQRVQNEIDQVKSQVRGSFLQDKIGVPITADTRDYVQSFTSDVLSTDGHRIKVGVFMEDGAYKLKVNEIQGQTITATAAVEFSGSDLERAVARAKEIVEGDFPRMQVAVDSAKTYAEFAALTSDVQRKLSASSFVVTSQFEADTSDIDRLIGKYSTEVTQAPVNFDPNTAAADQARQAISQPIIVPVSYQPTGNIPRRARGGVIEVPGFSTGGSPGGYIRGPGSTTSDSILAAVSNKEYIVKALAVRKYGLPFMNALNAGTLDMDRVKSAMGEGGVSTSGGTGESMTVNLTLNGRQIGGLSGSRSSVMGLVDALHEVARQTGG